MKKTLATVILAALTAAGVFAQSTPPFQPGNGKGKGKVERGVKGKKSGPQDGSGPIHNPGTGGGTGRGQRGPRR
ncbi:MAG: hypothetical protein ACUVS7_06300 [Bryobacteraceae bacterium]